MHIVCSMLNSQYHDETISSSRTFIMIYEYMYYLILYMFNTRNNILILI